MYSTKQYCKSILSLDSTNSKLWKFVWMGFVPPKLEVFCWQLLRGRIAVKDQLARRGLLDWNKTGCIFCKVDIESVGHLFSCAFCGKYGCIAAFYRDCLGCLTKIPLYSLWLGSILYQKTVMMRCEKWLSMPLFGPFGLCETIWFLMGKYLA
ncbi:hypothetical protein CRYUN_Cryun38cG0019500 [Craigia yunnanensis]